jgi:uncharacterized protein (TIGR00299 family) protein
MSRILYFDCRSGISGDMTVGALLDLGIDREAFLEQLDHLDLEGASIRITKKNAFGIMATDFEVVMPNSKTPRIRRTLSDIEQLIDSSGLESQVKQLSKQIFRSIAEAESKVHGVSIDEIHFHEIGAIDSIVDIVGTSICISMLKVDRIFSSPLHLGRGFVDCDHGTLPVPAPATVEILRGVPVYSTGIEGELVTPTGAAIITNLTQDFIDLPPMVVEIIGYGQGKKDYGIPNVLRVFLGRGSDTEYLVLDKIEGMSIGHEEIILLETNIDDLSPEIYSYLLPKLLERGALDVFLTNIMMKKGRPGVMLSVLCDKECKRELEELIFTETTTLGIRYQTLQRQYLERKIVTLDSRFGPIRAKAAFKGEQRVWVKPEYEACKKIAEEHGLPLHEVYEQLRKDLLEG